MPLATVLRPVGLYGPRTPDEVLLGITLTSTWMLNTGRCLGAFPLLHDLDAAELIDFWAIDMGGTKKAEPSGSGLQQPISHNAKYRSTS